MERSDGVCGGYRTAPPLTSECTLCTLTEMATVIPATKARNKFFDILNAVIYKGEEFVVEKNGEGRVRIMPVKDKPSPGEIDRVLARARKVFGTKRPKYWSAVETPAWRKKERKYLKELHKKVNKYDR